MKPAFKFLRWRYASDEHTTVELQPIEQEAPLSAADLERATIELASVRFAVLPRVPESEPPFAEWLIPAESPRVTLGFDNTMGQPVLNIRDTGFGWLHYRLADEQLEYLASAIAEHFHRKANSSPPSSGKH